MATLIWRAPMRFYSPLDEKAFFDWLKAIPEVREVEGKGRELYIQLRDNSVDDQSLRELIALYGRYKGTMSELAQFASNENESWFKSRAAYWYARVFEGASNA